MKLLGTARVVKPYSITNLPPLIIGGAVFNTQYSTNPRNLPVADILDTAFSHGLNAIDTSPYYGPLEEILGEALAKIAYSRDQYYICTKAGRIRLDEFDYSAQNVRRSVERSIERLGATYLDLVYMHDIEFVSESDIFGALRELARLKRQGLVRNIGVSGYPVDFLLAVAQKSQATPEIGALDAILSYSNGCIQNEVLFDHYQAFLDAGVRKVMNGSILSMSLLRSDVTHAFHPAPQALKDRVYDVAQELQLQNVELADLATRFALKRWLFDTAEGTEGKESNPRTAIVLGVSTIEELAVAIDSYWRVKEGRDDGDEALFAQVRELLGHHFNETWASGIERN